MVHSEFGLIDVSADAQIQELHDAGVRGTRFNFVAHLGGAPDQGFRVETLAYKSPQVRGSRLQPAYPKTPLPLRCPWWWLLP